jgi:hypothetical protein
MKKLQVCVFAFALMISIVFIGSATSSNGTLAVNGQIVSDMKRLGRTTYREGRRGGRWVTIRVYRNGKWVTRRVWQSGKWVAVKTANGTKRVFVRSRARLP